MNTIRTSVRNLYVYSKNCNGRKWSSRTLHTCCGFAYIFNYFISFSVFENKKEFIYSHPKLRKLEEIVIEHFKSWKKGCSGKYQQLREIVSEQLNLWMKTSNILLFYFLICSGSSLLFYMFVYLLCGKVLFRRTMP